MDTFHKEKKVTKNPELDKLSSGALKDTQKKAWSIISARKETEAEELQKIFLFKRHCIKTFKIVKSVKLSVSAYLYIFQFVFATK